MVGEHVAPLWRALRSRAEATSARTSTTTSTRRHSLPPPPRNAIRSDSIRIALDSLRLMCLGCFYVILCVKISAVLVFTNEDGRGGGGDSEMGISIFNSYLVTTLGNVHRKKYH